MKKIILVVSTLFLAVSGFAQYREVETRKPEKEETGGFQKDHLFTGGGVNLSLSSYNFAIGASPVFGYSFNKWFDAGVGLSVIYNSAREVYQDQYGNLYSTGNKIHYTDVAPLVFARVYPIKFLFIQLQAEENFISEKYLYGSGEPSDKFKFNSLSLLPGIGYCGGREDVGDFFYYISLSVDVLKNKKSPYVEVVGNEATGIRVDILPIIKAGIQIPLFQGGGKGNN